MSIETQHGHKPPAPDTPREPSPIALTIAGFDPTSGAGLTADLKVFAAHGLYGVAAATALTVQSTVGVRRVQPISDDLLTETLTCLAEDLPPCGIKIGMLATAPNVNAVAAFLEHLGPHTLHIVLDPVLRSSSGHVLLDTAGIHALRTHLLPLVTCITPNLDELLLLTDSSPLTNVDQREAVSAAAASLGRRFPKLAIVITGGHLANPDDYVLTPNVQAHPPTWLPGERIDTTATHGTGCAYSSALLCGLIAGRTVLDAAAVAKRYVTEALRAATPMGGGGGSMHHLYASHIQPLSCPQPQRKRP